MIFTCHRQYRSDWETLESLPPPETLNQTCFLIHVFFLQLSFGQVENDLAGSIYYLTELRLKIPVIIHNKI